MFTSRMSFLAYHRSRLEQAIAEIGFSTLTQVGKPHLKSHLKAIAIRLEAIAGSRLEAIASRLE